MFTDLHKQMVDAYAAVSAAETALLRSEKGNVRARKEYVQAVKEFLGLEEHFRPYVGLANDQLMNCVLFRVGQTSDEDPDHIIYQPETYIKGPECEAITFGGQTNEGVANEYHVSSSIKGMMIMRQPTGVNIYLARPDDIYQEGSSLAEELEMPGVLWDNIWTHRDCRGRMSLAWKRSHEVSIDELCAHENQDDPDRSLFSRFYNGLQRATTLAIRGHQAEKERLDGLKGKHTEGKKKLKESVAVLENVGKQNAA